MDWSLCAWCGKDFERREVPAAAIEALPQAREATGRIAAPGGASPTTATAPAALPSAVGQPGPNRSQARPAGSSIPAPRRIRCPSVELARRTARPGTGRDRRRPRRACRRRRRADRPLGRRRPLRSTPPRPTPAPRRRRPATGGHLHVHHRGPRGPGPVRRRLAGHARRPRHDRRRLPVGRGHAPPRSSSSSGLRRSCRSGSSPRRARRASSGERAAGWPIVGPSPFLVFAAGDPGLDPRRLRARRSRSIAVGVPVDGPLGGAAVGRHPGGRLHRAGPAAGRRYRRARLAGDGRPSRSIAWP